MNDLELLRTYEPILRMTDGESFLPTAVDDYVKCCSLWVRPPNRPVALVVPEGDLDLDVLARYTAVKPGHTLFLRFVQEPLEGREYGRWLQSRERTRFHSRGRLARVGLGPRLVDAAFSLSLLLRGTVPGGTVGAAVQRYREIARTQSGPVYYGRIMRSSGYIILHYLYFYAMNDWRSTFNGANDHEADWEQVFVFLEDNPADPPTPAWVAFAAHDESGDDLRRRWDDPLLTRIGTHPVVFVGAGSHASYFLPGEYLTSVELRFVRPILNVVHAIERVWRNWLQQGDPQKLVERLEGFLSVPFIDYARGDGISIGAGQAREWEPVLLEDETEWVDSYRGLWGLDAQDPFAGESAPAGPKYNPNGTMRRSWYNPLGWAGLSKVAPPQATIGILNRHIEELEAELDAVRIDVQERSQILPRLELEVRSLRQSKHLGRLHSDRRAELRREEDEFNELRRREVDLVETLSASRHYLKQLKAGNQGDPQSHIHRLRRPQSEREIRKGALAEIWAALSVGLLLLGLVSLVFFGFGGWFVALGLTLSSIIFIESALHKRLEQLLLNVTIILAVITTAVLVYEYYWEITLTVVAAIGALILADNLRELRKR